MATFGNQPPQPEQRRRFSPETIAVGDRILGDIDSFDAKQNPERVRIVMSAKKLGKLADGQEYKNLPGELKAYLEFRIKDKEKEAALLEAAAKKSDEELEAEKALKDARYLLERLHPEDDAEQIENINKWVRDNKTTK